MANIYANNGAEEATQKVLGDLGKRAVGAATEIELDRSAWGSTGYLDSVKPEHLPKESGVFFGITDFRGFIVVKGKRIVAGELVDFIGSIHQRYIDDANVWVTAQGFLLESDGHFGKSDIGRAMFKVVSGCIF